MTAFFDECIEIRKDSNGQTSVYYVKDSVNVGTQKVFFDKSRPLSEYTVIYSSEAKTLAENIVAAIKKYAGVELKISDDSAAIGDKEILVGKTNRPESSSIPKPNSISYTVKAVGDKIVIYSGSDTYINTVLDALVNSYMRTAPGFALPADVDDTSIRYSGESFTELSSDSDIRIMSFNILSEEWASDAGMAPRIAGVAGCILYYKPDVIGIQEVSTKWYKELYNYLSDEYVFINSNILNSKNNNYTALAYRKATVKLAADEVYFYSVGNSQRLRLINMGYFEHIETGKKFIVTNTHYNANHKGATIENQNRITQATEFVARIKQYAEVFECPVISTGDYNCNETSDPYKKMTEGTNIFETKAVAERKGEIFLTYHSLGVKPGAGYNSIDHILYTGNITPKYYTTLIDNYLLYASDHCPIFCDFKFN